jgi:hypothetical protein
MGEMISIKMEISAKLKWRNGIGETRFIVTVFGKLGFGEAVFGETVFGETVFGERGISRLETEVS